MKNNLKEFLQNKKDLFVFLGLLVVTFITVIAIAQVTMKNDDMLTVAPNPDVEDNSNDNDTTINPDEEKEEVYYISNPYSGNKVVVRTFYNINNQGSNSDSIITSGDTFVTSTGIGFANEDNTTFEVLSIYSGIVTSVIEDEVMGTTITIDHGDDLISTYYSLETATVVEGEEVTSQTVIGWAGASSFDLNAGVHVHVEVFSKDTKEYLDITTIIGKTMDDVVSAIK